LEGALKKLQEGSKQWVDIVNELAAEDRRYRRELEDYRDRILLQTTPSYQFVATIQRGSVAISSPEDEEMRRRFDEEFGTHTSNTDTEQEPPTSAPAAAVAIPPTQQPKAKELPPNHPNRDDDATYEFFKRLPRSGPQLPRRPRSGTVRSKVQ
jgi:hypothetical protein